MEASTMKDKTMDARTREILKDMNSNLTGTTVEEILQALPFVLKAVAEFHFVHGVVLVALFRTGLATAPAIITDVEDCRLRRSPSAGLADEVVEVFERSVGLDEQLNGEVFDFW